MRRVAVLVVLACAAGLIGVQTLLARRARALERRVAAFDDAARAVADARDVTGLAARAALVEVARPPQDERLARLEARVAELESGQPGWGDGGWLVPGPPVPPIDGTVIGVQRESPGLVLLSVGAGHGVERGFHFSVYRGTQFVGKVIVERLTRDVAFARVLFVVEGQTMQPGDAAATRLP